jgi:hypothetical protein
MESLPSAAELRALRVVDLKQRLAEVGLPQAGEITHVLKI